MYKSLNYRREVLDACRGIARRIASGEMKIDPLQRARDVAVTHVQRANWRMIDLLVKRMLLGKPAYKPLRHGVISALAKRHPVGYEE